MGHKPNFFPAFKFKNTERNLVIKYACMYRAGGEISRDPSELDQQAI